MWYVVCCEVIYETSSPRWRNTGKLSIKQPQKETPVKRQTVCCNYIYAVKSVRRRRHRFCATIYFKHVPRPFIPKTFLLEKAFCFYVLYIASLSNELTKLIFWYETQLLWYYFRSNDLKDLIMRFM